MNKENAILSSEAYLARYFHTDQQNLSGFYYNNEFSPEMGWLAFPSPAKLNLFLQIIGRRDDGYHLLQTVFRLLEWGDTVYIRPNSTGEITRYGESVAGVLPQDDLLIRAAHLLRTRTQTNNGVDIAVTKRIPAGGGFGGGSSNAATVLQALNHYWGTGLDDEQLAALGVRLGADVPVFVRGENAWAEGVGEIITPIELPKRWYLLVDPKHHVATAKLFSSPLLTRNSLPIIMGDFVPEVTFGNAFEPVLRCLEPSINTVLNTLGNIGKAHVTGSGAGCFIECLSQEVATAHLGKVQNKHHAWVVQGASRSPLLTSLKEHPVLQGRRQAA